MSNRTAATLLGISISALSAVADMRTLWPVPKSTDGATDLSTIVGKHQYTVDGDSLISVSVVKSEFNVTSDGGKQYRYWWGSESGEYTIPSVACGWDIVNNEHVYLEIPIKNIAPHMTSSGSVFNGLTSVSVSEGIETLSAAFDGANELKSVSLPSTLKTIGAGSFRNCSALTTIDIPDSVETIGTRAFLGCDTLKHVKFPASLTAIGEQAFQDSGVVTVSLPEGCSAIGQRAFSGCVNLSGIAFGGCSTIGDYAFENCTGLSSVDFPGTVKSIGSSAFFGCSALSRVTFADGLESIGGSAFRRCSMLTDVLLPDGLVSIGAYAFQDCTGISRLSIPTSVSSVGSSAFYNCAPKDLTEGSMWTMTYSSVTNFTLLPRMTTFGNKLRNCKALEKVTLPDSVTKIEAEAFGGCTNLSVAAIPDSVEIVGNSAFYNCKRLSALPLLGGSVTNWGASVFRYCTGVTKLTVPGNMKSIPGYMFANCSNLVDVAVEEGVETIPQTAFLYDDLLWRLSLPSTATNLSYSSYSNTDYAKNLEVATFHQLNPPKNVAKAFLRNFTGIAYYPPDNADDWKSALSDAGLSEHCKAWSEALEGEPGAVDVDGVDVPYGWLSKYGLISHVAPEVAARMETGKIAASGRPMEVWQDYVAGTDPTDVGDVFRASITFDGDGRPVISWTPEFTDSIEAAKRRYRKYGKVRLQDKDWTEFADGEEDGFNFFKVTVEMR